MKVYHNKLKRRFFIIISSLSAESYREGLQAPTETCKTTCVYTHTHRTYRTAANKKLLLNQQILIEQLLYSKHAVS